MRELDGLNEARLSWAFGLPIDRLNEIASDPGAHYRTWDVERRGGENRRISAPVPDFMTGLKRFHRRELLSVPVHSAAACAPGCGVVWAARQHRFGPVLLQLDLETFFPSVTRTRVVDTLLYLGCPSSTVDLLADLLVLDDGLPQGSPTSVAVANLVLRKLDARIRGGLDDALAYTRYVDDISISGGNRLFKLESRVIEWIEDDGWAIHPTKGGCYGRDQPQMMLGLLVNSNVTASPEWFADLRDVLRSIVRGDVRCSPKEWKKLEGKVRWLEQVNPDTTLTRLFLEAAATRELPVSA